jgi:hypothetical protein
VSDEIIRGSEKVKSESVKRESELRTVDGGRGRESHRTTEIGKPRMKLTQFVTRPGEETYRIATLRLRIGEITVKVLRAF